LICGLITSLEITPLPRLQTLFRPQSHHFFSYNHPSKLTYYTRSADTTPQTSHKMASRIPTSTSVTESAVISAPFGTVWHHIKLASFPNFWTALSKAEPVHGASPDTDIVKWTFKDGTELEVKLEAHSVCSLSTTFARRRIESMIYSQGLT